MKTDQGNEEKNFSGERPESPRPAPEWRPIETAPKDKSIIVTLIYVGKLFRVSDAHWIGIGWYDIGGKSCHWATHWIPMPAIHQRRETATSEARALESTTEPRVCERGVDGNEEPEPLTSQEAVDTLKRVVKLLESIEENGKYDGVLPKARVLLRGVIGHWGDFSPAPPIEDETHEFDPGAGDMPAGLCCRWAANGYCGQPSDAPVHKVSEPQHVLLTKENCGFLHCPTTQCPVCEGGLAVCTYCGHYETELSDDPVCHAKGHPARTQPAEPQRNSVPEPPARVWLHQEEDGPWANAVWCEDRVADSDAAYAHLEPIQRAVNDCVAASSTKDGVVYVNEKVWEALVALVKESK